VDSLQPKPMHMYVPLYYQLLVANKDISTWYIQPHLMFISTGGFVAIKPMEQYTKKHNICSITTQNKGIYTFLCYVYSHCWIICSQNVLHIYLLPAFGGNEVNWQLSPNQTNGTIHKKHNICSITTQNKAIYSFLYYVYSQWGIGCSQNVFHICLLPAFGDIEINWQLSPIRWMEQYTKKHNICSITTQNKGIYTLLCYGYSHWWIGCSQKVFHICLLPAFGDIEINWQLSPIRWMEQYTKNTIFAV
jgi:ribosomal protein S14